ncbi:response regulator transcription factor [Cellulomonas denverensis]|uniref:Response regulator transcription factor n=1 Tax=Cellulomonas denverensis TaxID=264297 RepID=A0A7X6KS72_9CELL|nr:response regulator transcription factor [Cellulomonas denverensis]NKY21269.1 response regulator transcription factor [Cellulomonas denverensis]GIG24562.1 DNA-binding response regulator [Cellulomonas denverensis]
MRVLVVEDDDRLARALSRALRSHGYPTEHARGVTEARLALAQVRFAVVLVDLGLADGDGLAVVRDLRGRPGTAVLAVTARGSEAERVQGLRAGADDYLVKPFGAAELVARIEAVLRRVRLVRDGEHPERVHRAGGLEVDPAARRARFDGEDLSLTRREFDLLDVLVRHAGRTVTRERLLDQVWQTVWEGNSRTLDTHIATLRRKLAGRVTIVTARGIGYRLDPGDG